MATPVRAMFTLFVILGSLASLACAISSTATYYTPPYTPSACYGYTDEGVYIAAARSDIYNSGAACGTYYTIQCTGLGYAGDTNPCLGSNTVTVKVVDLCPGCSGAFDLSQEAFASIANLDAGVIAISY